MRADSPLAEGHDTMRRRLVEVIPRHALLCTTALAVGVIALAPTASAVPSVRPLVTTSVSCLPVPHPVTEQDISNLLTLAERKLAAAANGPGNRKPFGALRAEPEYQRTNSTKWTAGFFAAELWRMYERTGDKAWLKSARKFTKSLLPVARFTGSHDLNFMVGLPTGLGASLDPDSTRRTKYRDARMTAARTLAKRWNPNVRALKSDEYNGKWGVIVDSAMNAPLLIEVGRLIGGEEGARLESYGTEHMRTLARTFVRADGSTYHRMAFDPQTGEVLGPLPGQGLDPQTSTWARGQAWAINGFARAYELTGDPVLKDAATRTADFWLAKVPPACITAWDFDIDNPRSPRDSGASAIAVSGIQRLGRLLGADDADGAKYSDYAKVSLALLTSRWLTSTYSVNPGLLMQQTVNVNNDSREGSYVWGDYYLLDALSATIAP